MEQKLIVITADGKETSFNESANINFLQEHLLVTVKTDSTTMGIHWDRLAGLIQTHGNTPEASDQSICNALLRFDNGKEKKIKISQFHKCDLNLAQNIIKIIGANTTAILNLDFFQWYRIHR